MLSLSLYLLVCVLVFDQIVCFFYLVQFALLFFFFFPRLFAFNFFHQLYLLLLLLLFLLLLSLCCAKYDIYLLLFWVAKIFIDAFSISSLMFYYLYFLFCFFFYVLLYALRCVHYCNVKKYFVSSGMLVRLSIWLLLNVETRNETFLLLLFITQNKYKTKLTETMHTQLLKMIKHEKLKRFCYRRRSCVCVCVFFALMIENLFHFTSIKRRTFNCCRFSSSLFR